MRQRTTDITSRHAFYARCAAAQRWQRRMRGDAARLATIDAAAAMRSFAAAILRHTLLIIAAMLALLRSLLFHTKDVFTMFFHDIFAYFLFEIRDCYC